VFLGNCPTGVPLAAPLAEVCSYEAPENETRQLENWTNDKTTVVNKKKTGLNLDDSVSPYAQLAKCLLGQ
jgi:hypothetical protein